MIDKDNLTKESSKIFIDILKKYINEAENMNSYLDLEQITTNMIVELNDESMLSCIEGQKYDVIEIARGLKENDEECKDIILDNDKLGWITREIHDTFDYNSFEKDVKDAMLLVEKNYQE